MDAGNVWIELGRSNQEPNIWQALFACQICIYSFQELEKNKWGFNASALLDEALDRQKLFIESQYNYNVFQEDAPNQRTIALRCIQIPGSGLLLALIGKVCSPTQEDARREATAYCKELVAIFPYDYIIYPASSLETFQSLTGRDLLYQCNDLSSLVQVKRFETQMRTQKTLTYIIGLWQTIQRSDDQIWRSLGNYPDSAILNISLRPTQLTDNERQLLWNMTQINQSVDNLSKSHTVQPYDEWAEPFIKRRLSPWKRFYYLQVHIAVPSHVPDNLLRGIGSAITRDLPDQNSPGFQADWPRSQTNIENWKKSLYWLEMIPSSTNNISMDRISNIADFSEVHAVFRFPFPPLSGLPNIEFVKKLE